MNKDLDVRKRDIGRMTLGKCIFQLGGRDGEMEEKGRK